MKKLFMVVVYVMLLSSSANTFAAAPPLTIILDDVPIKTDVAPIIKRNTTYVPIGFIAKELGATVEWNNPKITITMDDLKLELEIGRMQVVRNGKGYPMMAAPFLSEGRTMIPLKIVSSQLGCSITFDDSGESKIISLKKTNNEFVPPPTMDADGFKNSPNGKWSVKSERYYFPLNIALYLMDNTTKVIYEIYESNSDPVERWVDENLLMFYGNTNAAGKKGGTYLMLYDPRTKRASYIDKTKIKSAIYVEEVNSIIYDKLISGKITETVDGKLAYYRYSLENNTSTKISEKEYDKLKKMVDPDSD